jgi:hypothetical protein
MPGGVPDLPGDERLYLSAPAAQAGDLAGVPERLSGRRSRRCPLTSDVGITNILTQIPDFWYHIFKQIEDLAGMASA